MRLAVSTLLLAALLPTALPAEPIPYRLDEARSDVRFEVDFGEDRITGTMPVARAEIALDFDRPEQSRVGVTLNAAAAEASFPFATQALTGPRILATADYPEIRFESTEIAALPGPGARARVEGMLTIRDVTRPVTLDAEIFRQADVAAGERSALSVHLGTEVDRRDFGADGWLDLVGAPVRIVIVARIDRDE